MKLIAATRVHSGSQEQLPDVSSLAAWCQQARSYADEVLVATDAVVYRPACQVLATLEPAVKVLQVTPWPGLTRALNAIIYEARSLDGHWLLLQSLEARVSSRDVERLKSLSGPEVLVVGGRLTENHGSLPGVHPITAATSPWNTVALWNLGILGLTGFLSVSDGGPGHPGGAEEVALISLLQHLLPGRARAVLTSLPDLVWDTGWMEDSSRLEHHRWKMPTKIQRAEDQLEQLGVPRGTVEVLD